MPKRYHIELSASQRQELERIRATHTKPYMRERAAAILKVAAGAPVSHVAASGLYQQRHRDQVTTWLKRYAKEGVAGLGIRQGRGRKPAFSPSALDGGCRAS